MRYLLDLLYLVLLMAVSPWLVYFAAKHGKYRQGWGAKLWGRVPLRSGQRRCVWLHAVSVGEVNLIKPVLLALEQSHPEVECVVSTTTLAGFELARQRYAPRLVFYCPLDFSWAVAAAMRRIRPDLLVLAELELWPNLMAAARRRGTRVAIVNGRLSERSWRGYRRIGFVIRRVMRLIDWVGAQSETYAARFRDLGIASDRVAVTGSVKFDGAECDRSNPSTRRLAELADFAPDDIVFLAGSTQQPEEKLALEACRRLWPQHPRLRLVLVPRHPERFAEVAKMLDDSGVAWTRRSGLQPGQPAPATRVLLVDTVGELGAWWGTATLAYVGGSMGARGGQNMIEPAAYGADVAFGPRTENFRDVVGLLLAANAATVVRDGGELEQWLRSGLESPAESASRGGRARELVLSQQGATRRTLRQLGQLLENPSASANDVRGGDC
jgi:3-deoxy-D-manno-octulosonic-acid transferase